MNDKIAKIGAFIFVIGFAFVTAVMATTCHRENAPTLVATVKDQGPPILVATVKDQGPLHGESPIFTVVPTKTCANTIGPFCDEWEWCNSSPPKVSTPEKLWNAYVVSGKDGPVLVCEWHDKRDER